MTASVQGNKSKHTGGSNERYLIRFVVVAQSELNLLGKYAIYNKRAKIFF